MGRGRRSRGVTSKSRDVSGGDPLRLGSTAPPEAPGLKVRKQEAPGGISALTLGLLRARDRLWLWESGPSVPALRSGRAPLSPRLDTREATPRRVCGAAQGHGEGTAAPGRAGPGTESPPFNAVLGHFPGETLSYEIREGCRSVELDRDTLPPRILGYLLKHRALSSSQMSEREGL